MRITAVSTHEQVRQMSLSVEHESAKFRQAVQDVLQAYRQLAADPDRCMEFLELHGQLEGLFGEWRRGSGKTTAMLLQALAQALLFPDRAVPVFLDDWDSMAVAEELQRIAEAVGVQIHVI